MIIEGIFRPQIVFCSLWVSNITIWLIVKSIFSICHLNEDAFDRIMTQHNNASYHITNSSSSMMTNMLICHSIDDEYERGKWTFVNLLILCKRCYNKDVFNIKVKFFIFVIMHSFSVRNNKSILYTLSYKHIHFIYIYHAPVHANIFNPFHFIVVCLLYLCKAQVYCTTTPLKNKEEWRGLGWSHTKLHICDRNL